MASQTYKCAVLLRSRGKGRSAVASAAYRSGQELTCTREGVTYDYTRRAGIVATGITLPEHAPVWAGDRQELWQRVETVERYKNAQLAREYRLSFPDELNAEQRQAVLQSFIHEQFTDNGYAADWAIHKPDRSGDARNWHAHVMVPMRGFDGDAFTRTKPQEWGNWNQRGERLIAWRSAWADQLNTAAAHYDLRDGDGNRLHFDHRSFADREVDQEPTSHLGPHATALERRGIKTDIGDLNRAVQQRNSKRRRDQNTKLSEKASTEETPALHKRRKAQLPSWATKSPKQDRGPAGPELG